MSNPYSMTLSLNVLKHLGFNLYSNIPAVISEVVANAYDADAQNVNIEIGENEIVITDDGHGMTLDDINGKFLHVGYARRENGEALSPILKRKVMGRKGIGKLSLFSIANDIEIQTTRVNAKSGKKEVHGFMLRRADIETQIGLKGEGKYQPTPILSSKLKVTNGTTIKITDFKKSIENTQGFLRKRLAKRFSVIDPKYKFKVSIDGKPITIADRDYFKKLQMIWFIGEEDKEIKAKFQIPKVNLLNGKIDGTDYEISGWIGAVEVPSDLDIDGVNNNKISILCRGKLAQEDILESFNEGGIYADYLIGEIHADFLDEDAKEDIATSSRQKINEDDTRYLALQQHIYTLLKKIQNTWTDLRNELALNVAIKKAEATNPILKQWFNTLKTKSSQDQAKQLFATIESLPFTKEEAPGKKKELYKQGIVAFEKLRLRESLHELSKLTTADEIRLAAVFTDLQDIEANLYYDIAQGRVDVINQFKKHLDANEKEKLLQQYLFDNLWLLNPSWERATEGNIVFEQNVEKEFGKITAQLSKEEKNGRMDIKFRTAAGKHIIIELKRYKPGYKVTPFTLAAQIDKYTSGLKKCLKVINKENETIESIVVLGELKGYTQEQFDAQLSPLGGRTILYDYLIDQSLEAYSIYMDRHKTVGKIRALIDQL
jgi:Histidine kinase-, DNA gyrase B-, and HSP90-like ATPase